MFRIGDSGIEGVQVRGNFYTGIRRFETNGHFLEYRIKNLV